MGPSSTSELFSMKGLFKIVLVSSCLVLLWNPLGSCNEGARLILSLDLRTFGYRHPVAERDFRAYAFLQDSVAFFVTESWPFRSTVRTIALDFPGATALPAAKLCFTVFSWTRFRAL